VTWIKLSDDFHVNDRVLPLTDAEFRLFVCSQTFAANLMKAHRDDEPGVLTREQARSLSRAQNIRPKAIQGLLDKGLWVEHPRGIKIYKFEKYLPTKKEEHDERGEPDPVKSAAGSKGAAARWQSDSKPDGNPDGKQIAGAWQTDGPVPNPVPNPVSLKGSTGGTARDAPALASTGTTVRLAKEQRKLEDWLRDKG
jgi:hypothetical protein